LPVAQREEKLLERKERKVAILAVSVSADGHRGLLVRNRSHGKNVLSSVLFIVARADSFR